MDTSLPCHRAARPEPGPAPPRLPAPSWQSAARPASPAVQRHGAARRIDRSGAPLAAAQAAGTVQRCVAELDAQGHASVGLVEVAADDPTAHFCLTDNIGRFTTRRYCDNPLVVQGPAAGPEVTAAGLFADVLRVAAGQGARL